MATRKRKSGPGRPPAAGEPRDVTVRLRCLAAEYDRWIAAAARDGLGFSEWARGALDDAAGRWRDKRES